MHHAPALAGHYNYYLVVLSVLVAMLSAYAALELAGRVTVSQGKARFWWLCCGAFAMGAGIWSMHYIGMLAFRLPVRVQYDWPTVLLSLLTAVVASGVGLFVVSRRIVPLSSVLAGSVFMGGGIAAMHYIGMEAMRLPAMCSYSPTLVTVSVAVAIVIAFAALSRSFAFRDVTGNWSASKLANALLLGAAIPTMHYIGMAAATFYPAAPDPAALRYSTTISDLGFASIALAAVVVLGLVIVTAIIDKRMNTQAEALESSEQRYRKIVETAFDAFMGIDPAGLITDWNTEAERAFGWSRAEAIGKPLSEIIVFDRSDGDSGVPEPRRLQDLLALEATSQLRGRIEVVARHRDRHEFAAEMAVSSIRIDGKNLFSVFVHDVTSRKLTEQEREVAKAAAEAANLAKGEFLANMSHEIRTPLNGIVGMTDLVMETELTFEQREYLETVKLSADALLGVINDILDFSKIEARKIDLEEAAFDLRECMEDSLKTLALRADEKGLELLCDIDAAVPEAVWGDQGRLRQIVTNLVGNAIKFTHKGEVHLRVQGEPAEDGWCTLHFSVTDTGIGIPSEKLATIFESFVQADTSTTREYGGTGLGLTISKRLVEIMGGRISIESTLGKGSQFQFSLQLRQAESSSAHRKIAAAPEILRGVKVLVIDDNKTNRRILEGLLSGWGMKPTAVADGEQALQHLAEVEQRETPYRLILTDMHMPKMDGFSVVEQIRQTGGSPVTTIMMLSSAGHRGDAARCQKLGVAAYLLKPIRQAELREAIARVLGAGEEGGDYNMVTRDSLKEERDPALSLNILLVEDNMVNQMLAVRMLDKRGHNVVAVSNGHAALAAMEARYYDLVLMDVQMPGLDGIETTILLRKKEKGTEQHQPVVAMTALVMKGDRERCLAAGMDGYLPKPIRGEELDQTLETYMEQRKRRVLEGKKGSGHLNEDELLERVGGDRTFLSELADVFRQDYPQRLRAIRTALAQNDAPGLRRSSHELKGALSNLAASQAREAVANLEAMGASCDLTGADAVFSGLEAEIQQVVESLDALCREPAL